MYLRNLRIVGDEFDTVEFSIFKTLSTPPMSGRTLKGSGELRSLNHRKPSVSIAGDIS